MTTVGRWAGLLLSAVLVLPTAASAQDANTGRNLAAACANCHGTNGHSVGGTPSLAGVAKGEIVQKMQEFRDGKRTATIMHQISKGYTDAQVDLIAGYFAAQRK